MDAYKQADLIVRQQDSGERYMEFLRVPALSMGVYTLLAGSNDPQQPHSEDEVYYVAYGKALIRVGDEDRRVVPGTIVYVPAQVRHYFHAISEDLTVLVFFAPAEYSRREVLSDVEKRSDFTV